MLVSHLITHAVSPPAVFCSVGPSNAPGKGYRLHVSGYQANESTAGDALSYHNGMPFTTYDTDNDKAKGIMLKALNATIMIKVIYNGEFVTQCLEIRHAVVLCTKQLFDAW